MNETKYYHTALESALMNGKSLKERIDTRIACLPKRKETHVRLPKRLILALVAAAILLIASVAVAAAVQRNRAFKDNTISELENTIQQVEEPQNKEDGKGWQPRSLILYNDVLSMQEDVLCRVSDGTMQLADLYYSGSMGIRAGFFYQTQKKNPCDVSDLTLTINGGGTQKAYEIDPFDVYADGHFCGAALFMTGSNPLHPDTTFVFGGKVNGEDFTLTYTFTKECFEAMRQRSIDSLKEHETLVERIPDEGTPVNYTFEGVTLAEVAVADNRMYYTVVAEEGVGNANRNMPETRDYCGFQPVIDGRLCEEFYLGVPEGRNPDGTVYAFYLPYTEELQPKESLITADGFAFRYEWATGKVTLPKDRAEFDAWHRENLELADRFSDADWIYTLDAPCGDVRVTDLVFHTYSLYGEIGIVLESEQGFMQSAEPPKVYINGVELAHVWQIDPLTSVLPYLSEDGKTCGWCMVGFSPADLGDTFTLTVVLNGETASETLNRSDAIRKNGESVARYKALFDY